MPAEKPWETSSGPVSNDGAAPLPKMDARLAGLLDRINTLATGDEESVPPDKPSRPVVTTESPPQGSGSPERQPGAMDPDAVGRNEFRPLAPTSLREAMLTETEVEALILKYLLVRGEAQGRGVADQIRLPFGLIEPLLRRLKSEQIVVYKDTTEFNDYLYTLTDLGRERAHRFMRDCSYYGSAPVSLEHYVASVAAQSLQHQCPQEADLRQAFSDLLINPQMFKRLGPAINSSRGLFLYGYPGNGKTSIAERITRCFGQHIWIPRALGVAGEIIRFLDPNHHQELPAEDHTGLLHDSRWDARWVKIRRPTIVVGGELTMDMLELQLNPTSGTVEAPFQLKSNCGTLVIDDFGRQRMSTDELLNRWIVPLEKRYDFLNLPSGKSLQVPFDQLVVFSTNLEPRDLVDDAFLRRIPYKIEVLDPTLEEFKSLFRIMCSQLGFTYEEELVQYVVDTHYAPLERPLRCCHPRDLLLQVQNQCRYRGTPVQLTREGLDLAAETYFAIM